MRRFIILAILITCSASSAQESDKQQSEHWRLQASGTKAQLRGLSVVDKNVAWASGSEGTVIRTVDGGKSWVDVTVPEANERQFRDIKAFSDKVAVVMQAGPNCKFFRTENGGKSWLETFSDPREEIFFDAMSFWDDKNGIVFGDPIDGRFSMAATNDGGGSWSHIAPESRPKAEPGEAAFAASGTCLITRGKNEVWIGLGAAEKDETFRTTRALFSDDRGKTWSPRQIPIVRGETSGINSIAFVNADHGIIVGGDFNNPDDRSSVVAITDDGGKTWRKNSGEVPGGYRSCVAVASLKGRSILVAVGINGSDLSRDFGNSWEPIGDTPFHAIEFTSDGKHGWAVGANGQVARWIGY
ncbi:hypothetical protein N9242_03265 [Vicingaceae bacterium]|nr:hypothetical protein [Vicingaceae bacterium]